MLYQRGTVQRTSPWGIPTWKKAQAWSTVMLPQIAALGYTTWVTGRSVYDIAHARDFDVVYTGAITATDQLAQLLDESVRQGFEQDMLVDAKWAESTDIAGYNDRAFFRPASFIFSNYYEFDNGQGHRVISDYSQNPRFTGMGSGLVMGNYANNGEHFKPQQLHFLQRHGRLPSQTIEQFIRGDFYV
jgi:hypothetical protein